MKKYLIIGFLGIYSSIFSQPLRQIERYNLDSIARSNIGKIVYSQKPSKILSYNPFDRFKLTASVQLNSSIFSNGLTTEDLLSFGAYDIRARYYVTPNLKVFQRAFTTGNNTFHTTGLVYKF